MKTSAFAKRFNELASQVEELDRSKMPYRNDFVSGFRVNDTALIEWSVKTRNLLARACGQDSEHYLEFVKREKPQSYQTNHERLLELIAVFRAAQEDYEGGYLHSVRSLVQAELFDTELDQARELLKGGFKLAAAVIAGVVLETSLRQACADAGIEPGSLNRMNAELSKAGVYNVLMQKQITALGEVRNKAAHGEAEEFNERDVSDMIASVERIVSELT